MVVEIKNLITETLDESYRLFKIRNRNDHELEVVNVINYLNELEVQHLEEIQNKYRSQEKINKIRFQVATKLLDNKKNKTKINKTDIEKIFEKVKNQYEENIFQNWKSYFGIFFPFLYPKSFREKLTRIADYIEKEIGFDCNVNKRIVDFLGPQSNGGDEAWIAIYNAKKEQQLAFQIFMSFKEGKVRFGLNHHTKKENNNLDELDDSQLDVDLVINNLKNFKQIIENDGSDQLDVNDPEDNENITGEISLNQILYGPPGTGKTYATIDEALRILDENFLIQNQNERSALKARFDELKTGKHIRFVTFHQSFCYEDFVEGLRAESDENGQLRYEVKDGVFKEICTSAAAKVTQQSETHIDLSNKKVWKMSLGNTLGEDSYIYDECIENGYALLGYGGLTDFSDCENREDIHRRMTKTGKPIGIDDYAVTAVNTFLLKMKVGDLLVVTDGNTKFRAIGMVTSNYRCISREAQGDWYGQCRDVNWLRVYAPSLPYSQLMHNQFSQMTLYQLRNGSIDMDALAALLNVSSPSFTKSASSYFQVNEVFGGGYKVVRATQDVLELTKPNGNIVPIGMSLLNTLVEYVENKKISLEDIRKKKVFDLVPDTLLEPHLVNGYNSILSSLVGKILATNQSTSSNQRTDNSTNTPKVLIIDEINRGNVSRIFGELITLIESSKREGKDEALETILPYSKVSFMVPANVYIIGTMNTSDRSLAGLDIALRRRFTFKEMPPRPDLLKDIIIDGVNIGFVLETMNERIKVLLDRDHCLGHAYFMPLRQKTSLEELSKIFRSQIIPLLQEYFFEDWERIAWILNDQNKPSPLAFVQRSTNELSKLFGSTAELLQNLDKRWHINDAAFNNIESYRSIIGITK